MIQRFIETDVKNRTMDDLNLLPMKRV